MMGGDKAGKLCFVSASKLSGLQASWPPGFLASWLPSIFVFRHLPSLGPDANPFLSVFVRHQLLHVPAAMAGHQVPGMHRFQQRLLV